ncbi:MAG: alginate export family protein [Ignavibacteriaceae bacterium]|nr:alginate export family protein [Ignavibacteriaceae bacterium]
MKSIGSALITIILFSGVFAQEKTDDWKITGQVQLRSELDGRDLSNKTYPLTYTSLRTRVGVAKTFEKSDLVIQMQDSRIFGEEATTLSNSKNLDLHQAYVKLNNPFELLLTMQAGRFEVAYGTERFFGSAGWHYVARSFDGVRFSFDLGAKTDLFALTHSDVSSYIANALPGTYRYPAKYDSSYSIYGFWMNKKINDVHTADFFGWYEVNRKKSNLKEKDVSQFTIGANHNGNYGDFSSLTEAAFQTGKRKNLKVWAYLISLQGGYKLNEVKFGLAVDLLSGNTSTDTENNNVFNPAFSSGHKFYGYMDYFINIPANTNNLGLNDYYFMIDWMPKNSKFALNTNVHHFTSNKHAVSGENIFGQEIDVTVKYNFVKGTTITWGGSAFLPGNLMKSIFKTAIGERNDTAFWSYVMITANL